MGWRISNILRGRLFLGASDRHGGADLALDELLEGGSRPLRVVLHLLVVGLLQRLVVFLRHFARQKVFELGEDDAILAVALARDGVVFHFALGVHLETGREKKGE